MPRVTQAEENPFKTILRQDQPEILVPLSGEIQESLTNRSGQVLFGFQITHSERLHIRTDDVRYSAHCRSRPQVVHRRLLETIALLQCLNSNVRANLVAKLETVCDRFRRRINVQLAPFNCIFSSSEVKRLTGKPNDS